MTLPKPASVFAAAFCVLAWAMPAPAQPLPPPLPSTLKEVADIRGSDGPGLWDDINLDTTTERAFIGRQRGVAVLDLKTLKLLPETMPGQDIHVALPLPMDRLLTTSATTGLVSIIGQSTGTLRAVISNLSDPDAAIVEPQSGNVLVAEAHGGILTVIDPQAGTAISRIKVGGKLAGVQAEGAGRVWVVISDQDQLALVDLAQRRVVSRYKLAGCVRPTSMDDMPSLGRLVVACSNGVAKVLSGVNGQDLGTVAVGPDPGTVMFADAKAWVPSASGLLTAISLVPTASLAAQYRTRSGARTGAFDALSRRFYLPYGNITGTGDHRALVPGSFGILVLQGQ